jgi:hypothetical protein
LCPCDVHSSRNLGPARCSWDIATIITITIVIIIIITITMLGAVLVAGFGQHRSSRRRVADIC